MSNEITLDSWYEKYGNNKKNSRKIYLILEQKPEENLWKTNGFYLGANLDILINEESLTLKCQAPDENGKPFRKGILHFADITTSNLLYRNLPQAVFPFDKYLIEFAENNSNEITNKSKDERILVYNGSHEAHGWELKYLLSAKDFVYSKDTFPDGCLQELEDIANMNMVVKLVHNPNHIKDLFARSAKKKKYIEKHSKPTQARLNVNFDFAYKKYLRRKR